MRFIVETVKVTGTPVYQCSICGVEARGTAANIGLRGLNMDNPHFVAQLLEREMKHGISLSHLPVGWATYGRYVQRCPEHTT